MMVQLDSIKSEPSGDLRKPYVKPKIERVRLVPEEAVLAACKGFGGEGPTSPTCTVFGGSPCADFGS